MKRRIVVLITVITLISTMATGCAKINIGIVNDSEGTSKTAAKGGNIGTGTTPDDEDNDVEVPIVEKTDNPITIVSHPVSCVVSGKEVSVGSYPEILLSEDFKAKYPTILQEIDELNRTWRDSVKDTVKEYASYHLKDEYASEAPYETEISVSIIRADEVLFSVLLGYYDFSGGAHPMHSTASVNIDVPTGKVLKLKDVLKNSEEVPKAIMDELYAAYPEGVEEFESYAFLEEGQTTLDQYRTKLEDDTYTWSILTEGLRIYFSPYEVATYAAGHLEVLLPFDRYPDMVKSEYIPEKDLDKESFVTIAEAEKEIIELTEQAYEHEAEVITDPN